MIPPILRAPTLFLVLAYAALAAESGLPLDPLVRTGKLPNGLTYYIRSNAKPEGRVSLRLVVNAGSVDEDDDQLGMAHFVEHMCFNGTEHFPKNDLVHYLQSVGVAFGPEINGYTTFDRTVYMLDLPTDKEAILSNGFLIMQDWAHGVTFASEELAKERGVVLEEWRLHQGASDRAEQKLLAVLWPDSKYAKRLPIGTRESILGCSEASIRRFYRDWYRPDLQAFVVVGDVDPAAVERRIRSGFGKIPASKRARAKVGASIPDRKATAASLSIDPEFPVNSVSVSTLLPPEELRTEAQWRGRIARQLALDMAQRRLREIGQASPPPFLGQYVFCGPYGTRRREVFFFGANVAETNLVSGLDLLLLEQRRLALHGFTAGELERAKKNWLKELARRYEERSKTDSPGLAAAYLNHFADGVAVPGIEWEYAAGNRIVPALGLGEVGLEMSRMLSAPNRTVSMECIAKAGVPRPTEAQMLALAAASASNRPPAWTEKSLPDRLVERPPAPGGVVAKREIEPGITELSFANGLKAVLKPTDFKKDEILMSAWAPGGHSTVSDSDYLSAINASEIVAVCGLGAFRKSDLEKILAGKSVGVGGFLEECGQGLRGSATRDDLSTMLELAYLTMRSPRRDPTDFGSWLTRAKESDLNGGRDPMAWFQDQAVRVSYGNHPRAPVSLRSPEEWGRVDLDRALSVWKDRFSDASAFTFFFVGSFTVEGITPLLATWLGNLPSTHRAETWKDRGLKPVGGNLEKILTKGTDKKSRVVYTQERPATWTPFDSHVAWALGNIFRRRLLDRLREDMGGVYGFGLRVSLDRLPRERAMLGLTLPCAPENAKKLTEAALAEINLVRTNGVTAEDMKKELEAERRADERDSRENSAWRWRLQQVWTAEKGDATRLTNYQAFIRQVTPENLKRVAAWFEPGGYTMVTLMPEERATPATKGKE